MSAKILHRLSCLAALIGLLCTVPAAVAQSTYYISWSAGNDSNNGLSSTAAWKTLDHAIAANAFVAGNTVRFMRGDTWYLGFTDWSINNVLATQTAPLTIKDFPNPSNPSAAAPVISRSWLLNSGWAYLGSNHWAHIAPGQSGSNAGPTTAGPIPVPDLFYDGVRLYPLQTNQISHLDGTNYVNDTSNIYVYAGPGDNPGSHIVEANTEASSGYTTVTDSSWTQVSSNLNYWKHPYTSTMIADLGLGAFYIGGRRYQHGTDLAHIRPYQWEFSSSEDPSNFYVYIPTSDSFNPNGKPMQFTPQASTLTLANDNYCIFQNLELRGGRWTSVFVGPPTQHITFDSCRFVEPGSWALTFVNTTLVPSQQWHQYPTVSNCYFEASYPATFNTLTNSADMNGITLEGSKNGLVQNNYLSGFGHTSIAFEGSQYCTMELNYTEPGAVNYGRAIEVFEGPQATTAGQNPDDYPSMYNVIRRNFFNSQQQVSSKLWGQNNYYYSNIWRGATQTANFTYDTSEGKEGLVYTLGETVGGNVFINNVFYDTAQSNISVNLAVVTGTGSVQTSTFANNVFGQWGQLPPAPGAPDPYGFRVNTPSKPSGSSAPLSTDQILKNNDFWKTSSSEMVLYNAVGTTGPNGNNLFTAAQANTYLAPNYVNNQQADPLFVYPAGTGTGTEVGYMFELQNGSPMAVSGLNGQALLGSNFGAFTDYDGLPWASTPSVGAYQYTASFVTGLNTSGAGLVNNVAEWVGLKFTPAYNVVVTKLGRMKLTGNSQTHTVQLVDADPLSNTVLGSVVVDLNNMPNDKFVFAPLPAPVTLVAGHSYYVVSLETSGSGGDFWYNSGLVVGSTSDASVDGAVINSSGTWTVSGGSGHACGPVSFKIFDRYTTPYAQNTSLDTTSSNTSASWRGMSFTTGGSPVTIGYLGRWVLSGSTQNHTVKLVEASSGNTIGSVTVSTAGQTGYVYAHLSAPVTLSASTTYYLLSQEFAGGDSWLGSASMLAPAGGTINSALYSLSSSGPYVPVGSPGNCYGPVGMKY